MNEYETLHAILATLGVDISGWTEDEHQRLFTLLGGSGGQSMTARRIVAAIFNHDATRRHGTPPEPMTFDQVIALGQEP